MGGSPRSATATSCCRRRVFLFFFVVGCCPRVGWIGSRKVGGKVGVAVKRGRRKKGFGGVEQRKWDSDMRDEHSHRDREHQALRVACEKGGGRLAG